MTARVERIARRALKISAGHETETELHKRVAHHLRTHGYAGRFFHCPNEGLRSKAYAATLSLMGLTPGVLDIVMVALNRWGRPSALEIKIPGGRLTPAEETWMAQAVADGWICGVAWSFEDAIETLRTWGYAV